MVNHGEEKVHARAHMNVVPCSSKNGNGRSNLEVMWVRFPPRSKYFFFTSCGSLISFIRANSQWVIHGFNLALKFTLQS